jgi:hypothetical protein
MLRTQNQPRRDFDLSLIIAGLALAMRTLFVDWDLVFKYEYTARAMWQSAILIN